MIQLQFNSNRILDLPVTGNLFFFTDRWDDDLCVPFCSDDLAERRVHDTVLIFTRVESNYRKMASASFGVSPNFPGCFFCIVNVYSILYYFRLLYVRWSVLRIYENILLHIFSAFTLLVGHRKGHLACKKQQSPVVLLGRAAEMTVETAKWYSINNTFYFSYACFMLTFQLLDFWQNSRVVGNS